MKKTSRLMVLLMLVLLLGLSSCYWWGPGPGPGPGRGPGWRGGPPRADNYIHDGAVVSMTAALNRASTAEGTL